MVDVIILLEVHSYQLAHSSLINLLSTCVKLSTRTHQQVQNANMDNIFGNILLQSVRLYNP
jgi:hypothetical protein